MLDPDQRSSLSALVVDPTSDAVAIVSGLSLVGFGVTLTDRFDTAKRLLHELRPLVLVTEVRLGAFNGLHLALQCGSARRRVAIIVTSSVPDPVLQRDAESLGATFMTKPFTSQELLAAVFRTALRQPRPDGTLDPVRPPFERRHGERRLTVAPAYSERRQSDRRQGIVPLIMGAGYLS